MPKTYGALLSRSITTYMDGFEDDRGWIRFMMQMLSYSIKLNYKLSSPCTGEYCASSLRELKTQIPSQPTAHNAISAPSAAGAETVHVEREGLLCTGGNMSMRIMHESVDGSQYESIWGADKELKEGFRSRFQGLQVRHRRRMVNLCRYAGDLRRFARGQL